VDQARRRIALPSVTAQPVNPDFARGAPSNRGVRHNFK
jgi:hypothetical protein